MKQRRLRRFRQEVAAKRPVVSDADVAEDESGEDPSDVEHEHRLAVRFEVRLFSDASGAEHTKEDAVAARLMDQVTEGEGRRRRDPRGGGERRGRDGRGRGGRER